MPPATETGDPRAVTPSVNWTWPVAVGEPTLAVNVTACPSFDGDPDVVTAVDEASGVTVTTNVEVVVTGTDVGTISLANTFTMFAVAAMVMIAVPACVPDGVIVSV